MKFNRVLVLGLAIATVFSANSPMVAQKKSAEPINVFIFSRTGGFSDGRSDSANDLAKALYKKNKIITVGTEDAADVTVEVLGRSSAGDALDTAASIRLVLRSGDYSANIEGSGYDPSWLVWKEAAKDAARQIEGWIKTNHDRLIARRIQK